MRVIFALYDVLVHILQESENPVNVQAQLRMLVITTV